MTKLEAFEKYMSQFAVHRGADMQWLMGASSHGRIFDYAWEQAIQAEREACAKVCDDIANKPSNIVLGVALDCAAAIRARGEK